MPTSSSMPSDVAAVPGVRPRLELHDLVWIVGFGRSGSTWLSLMLSALPGAAVWFEPNVARALAISNRPENAYEHSPYYVLGGLAEHWIPAVRAFVLAAARARYPDHRRGDPLILKDQNSGPQIRRVLEALPESRVIMLVRDPRDVMASVVDAMRATDGWTREWTHPEVAALDEEAFEVCVQLFVESVEAALTATDRHPGPKIIVTYEELRAEPHAVVRRICDGLGIAAGDDAIAASVQACAWEQIPVEQKGPGRFYRKATPGGWRDDLSTAEAAIVERHAAPLLQRFYGGAAAAVPAAAPAAPPAPAFAWPQPDIDPHLSATQTLIDGLRAELAQLRAVLDERTALLERINREAEQRLTIIREQQAAIDALRPR